MKNPRCANVAVVLFVAFCGCCVQTVKTGEGGKEVSGLNRIGARETFERSCAMMSLRISMLQELLAENRACEETLRVSGAPVDPETAKMRKEVYDVFTEAYIKIHPLTELVKKDNHRLMRILTTDRMPKDSSGRSAPANSASDQTTNKRE